MLGRYQTEIGHELARIGEAGDVAEFSNQGGRGHHTHAAQCLQRLHHCCERPLRQRCFDVCLQAVASCRRRLDGRNAVF
jgi:hypothetical protein